MMELSPAGAADLFASAMFGAATCFFVYGLVVRISGRAILVAALVSLLWALGSLASWPHWAVDSAHSAALSAYSVLMVRILRGERTSLRLSAEDTLDRITLGILVLSALSFVVVATWRPTLTVAGGASQVPPFRWDYLCLLMQSLAGLFLVEQLVRNTRSDYRWHLKFLCIGLAIPFLYGFFLFVDGMMFRLLDPELDATRAAVSSLTVPFLILATVRNRDKRLHVSLSHRLVIQTSVLLVSGIYVLLLGAAAFYVRTFGGDWGSVLQTMLVASGVLGMIVLLGSSTLRDRARIAILRNVFEYKFDYREEWLRVTRQLADSDAEPRVGIRAIRAVGETVGCTRGALWRFNEHTALVSTAQYKTGWRRPVAGPAVAALAHHMSEHERIIDLQESENDDTGIDLGPWSAFEGLRYLVPLMIGDRAYGVMGLDAPVSGDPLIWEDFDLLRVVARQAALLIAQNDAAEALSRSSRFDALNQMSAFMIHDIKTVVAQLSLLSGNASRHRDNPEFVSEMIRTVDNTVTRMSKLLAHLRGSVDTSAPVAPDADQIEFARLLPRILQALHDAPAPRVREASELEPPVLLDGAASNGIVDALIHLARNGQEAAGRDGQLELTIETLPGWLSIAIIDDGPGMTAEFVRDRLFDPFSSEKGLAGMGVGAFQARELVRAAGGDVLVDSVPDEGTRFTVLIPVAGTNEAPMEN